MPHPEPQPEPHLSAHFGAQSDVPVGTVKGPFVHLGGGGWAHVQHIVTIEPAVGVPGVTEIVLDVTDPDSSSPLTLVAKLDTSGMLNAVVGAMLTWERMKSQEQEAGRLDALDEEGREA